MSNGKIERSLRLTLHGSWELTADLYEWLGYRVKRSWIGRTDCGVTWRYLVDSRWQSMLPLTESIDAAVTLIPASFEWQVSTSPYGCVAILTTINRGQEHFDRHSAGAHTAALAICGAVLRAVSCAKPYPRGARLSANSSRSVSSAACNSGAGDEPAPLSLAEQEGIDR